MSYPHRPDARARVLAVTIVVVLLAGLGSLPTAAATPSAPTAATAPVRDASPQVVGGEAALGVWPAVTAIGERGRAAFSGSFCGGTLIHPQWVVTAAHCVQGTRARDLVAYVGRQNLQEPTGTKVDVTRIKRAHWIQRLDRNDIALLKLRTPVEQTPMPLADMSDYRAHTPAAVLGWGSTRRSGRGHTPQLQQGRIQLTGAKRCQRVWGNIDRRSQVCAGLTTRRTVVDSCNGDSGGPLVVYAADGTPLLAGIASFGAGRCGLPGQPGVYTKAPHYAAWILQTILDG